MLKQELREYLHNSILAAELTDNARASIGNYCDRGQTYFSCEQYLQEELESHFNGIEYAGWLRQRRYFLLKRRLLIYQKGLTN